MVVKVWIVAQLQVVMQLRDFKFQSEETINQNSDHNIVSDKGIKWLIVAKKRRS